MIKEKKVAFFLRNCADIAFEIKSPNLPLTPNFSKETTKTFLFLVVTIMTSYDRIEDDVIKIFSKISKDFCPWNIPTKFHHHLT